MTLPLVSCIMPTANRRALVPRAIRYFLAQNYPNKELIIMDDGSDSVADLIPVHPEVRYLRLIGWRPLGVKRNECVREARGDLVMHWDDDDWMAPYRIRYQVEELLKADAEVCGLPRMLFYDAASKQMYLYQYPRGRWLAGGSLLYRKEFWRRSPFPAMQVGSDTAFIFSQPLHRAAFLADYRFYVAYIHPGNTSPKFLDSAPWSLWKEGKLADVTGPSADFDPPPPAPARRKLKYRLLSVANQHLPSTRIGTLRTLQSINAQDARLTVIENWGAHRDRGGAIDCLKALEARGDIELIQPSADATTGAALHAAATKDDYSYLVVLENEAFPPDSEWLDRVAAGLQTDADLARTPGRENSAEPRCLVVSREALRTLGPESFTGRKIATGKEIADQIVKEAGRRGLRVADYSGAARLTEPRKLLAQWNAQLPEMTVIVSARIRPSEMDKRRNLRACLIALNLQSLARWRYRIVLVEEDGAPQLEQFAAGLIDNYHLVRNSGPRITTTALREALAACGDAICLVGPEFLVPPDFLQRGLDGLRSGQVAIQPYDESLQLNRVSTPQAINDRLTAPMARRYIADYEGAIAGVALTECLFLQRQVLACLPLEDIAPTTAWRETALRLHSFSSASIVPFQAQEECENANAPSTDCTEEARPVIGIGICTFQSPEFVSRWCYLLVGTLIPQAAKRGYRLQIVVSSADPVPPREPLRYGIRVISGSNLGVAHTKNRALHYLENQGCEFFFLLEDDCHIPSWTWFESYIEASRETGLEHLMFGPISQPGTWEVTGKQVQQGRWLFREYRRLRDPQCTPGVITFLTRGALSKAGGLDARFVGRGFAHVEWTERISIVCGLTLPSPMWYLDITENRLVEFPGSSGSRGWSEDSIRNNEALLASIRSGQVERPVPNLSFRHADATIVEPDGNDRVLVKESDLSPDEPLSVCITVKNRAPLFRRALDSIAHWFAADPGACEVVVSDFASDDCDIAEELQSRKLRHQIVRMDGFFSRTRGLHAAAQAAQNRVLIFLDADMLVTSASFGARVRRSLAPGQFFFPICYSLHRDKPAIVNDASTDTPAANGYWRESGFGLVAVLKQDYLRVGGWDRRLSRWGGEDNDFLWHCRNLGFRVERHRVHELFHQWHPTDISSKDKYANPAAASLVGRWRPPPERGWGAPDPGCIIQLAPAYLEKSLQRWRFHTETLAQFRVDPSIPLEETAYFRGVRRYKENGGVLWRECTNDSAILRRVERFRDLFLRMQKYGYDIEQPIAVRIGANGEIDVRDGHHRAAIAIALGWTIPAQVIQRHPAWIRLVDSAWQLYGGHKLYQEIDHPEFGHWNVARDCRFRGQAIRHLEPDWTGLRVLDIGSCHGGLAFEMADAGAAVTAAESNDRYLRCGSFVEERLRVGKPRVTWHSGDAFEELAAGWDWVLCLSVLHHEIKAGGQAQLGKRLQSILGAVRRGIVIEIESGDATQMAGCSIPSAQEELGEYIQQVTPGQLWIPILKGVPAKARRSASDRRWLWAAFKGNCGSRKSRSC